MQLLEVVLKHKQTKQSHGKNSRNFCSCSVDVNKCLWLHIRKLGLGLNVHDMYTKKSIIESINCQTYSVQTSFTAFFVRVLSK